MHVAQALIEMEMSPLRPLHAMTHNRRLAVSKHIADSIGLSPLAESGAEPSNTGITQNPALLQNVGGASSPI